MLRVILVGYGELASSLMLGILESGHKLVGVFRWDRVELNSLFLAGRDFIFPNNFASLIKTYKIPEIKARSINSSSFLNQALKLQPDVIIVGSWGEILKKGTIILPRIACVNCHPSLLPAHRGSNPYASAIRTGETKTGITFHLVDKKIDTGPILLQKEVGITQDDTGDSLRDKCAYKARESVKELLDGLECARFLPQKQNESQASYFPRISEEDTRISWNKPALAIHNQIRGLHPWANCYTQFKNQFIMINSSKIIELDNPVTTPGKVLSKNNNGMVVSTADPDKAVFISGLEIYGFMGKFLSSHYINNKINIGDYLEEV